MSDENTPLPGSTGEPPLELPKIEIEAAPPPLPPSDEPTSEDKLWGLLAYVLSPVVPIIILLMEEKKNRPFLKAHVWQALIAGLAAVLVTTVVGIIPVVQCISPIVGLAAWIALIYYGLQAFNGKTFTIPVITDFVKKQGWG